MDYLLYLMFRCDKRCDGCDGKFGNLVGTKHTYETTASLSRLLSISQSKHWSMHASTQWIECPKCDLFAFDRDTTRVVGRRTVPAVDGRLLNFIAALCSAGTTRRRLQPADRGTATQLSIIHSSSISTTTTRRPACSRGRSHMHGPRVQLFGRISPKFRCFFRFR